MRGMSHGEPHIGDSGQLEPPSLIVSGLHDGRDEGGEKKLGAFGRDGRDERLLVREVVVGRRRRDACSAGDVPERQPLGAYFGQDLQSGRYERLS
jgi:hypothetical protein